MDKRASRFPRAAVLILTILAAATLLPVVALAAASLSSPAPGTWTSQTSNTTSNLNAVSVVSSTQAFAAGDGSAFRVLSGTEWVGISNSGLLTPTNFFGASFIGPAVISGTDMLTHTVGWVSGSQGRIWRVIIDSSAQWELQKETGLGILQRVLFLQQQPGEIDVTGWAVGEAAQVLVTHDSGKSWFTVPSGQIESTANFNSVIFLNSRIGFIAGDGGVILKSINGGDYWRNLPNVPTLANLHGIDCYDPFNCAAVGDGGAVVYTVNGGANWIAGSSGVTSTLYDVNCPTLGSCWATGASGVILYSSDGGATWAASNSGTAQSLYDLEFRGPSVGKAVGGSGTILSFVMSPTVPMTPTVSLTGTVTKATGRPGDSPAGAEVVLFNASARVTTTTDASGAYTFTDITPGVAAYTVSVQMPGYLTAQKGGVSITASQTTRMPTASLAPGDVKVDSGSVINIFDLILVGQNWQKVAPTPAWTGTPVTMTARPNGVQFSPGTGAVSGTFSSLQGRENTDKHGAKVCVGTFTRNATTESCSGAMTMTNANGSYLVTGVTPGTVTVTAYMEADLFTRQTSVTVEDGLLTIMPNVSLLTGDLKADANNKVDIFDLILLGQNWQKATSNSSYWPGTPTTS